MYFSKQSTRSLGELILPSEVANAMLADVFFDRCVFFWVKWRLPYLFTTAGRLWKVFVLYNFFKPPARLCFAMKCRWDLCCRDCRASYPTLFAFVKRKPHVKRSVCMSFPHEFGGTVVKKLLVTCRYSTTPSSTSSCANSNISCETCFAARPTTAPK